MARCALEEVERQSLQVPMMQENWAVADLFLKTKEQKMTEEELWLSKGLQRRGGSVVGRKGWMEGKDVA